MNGIEEYKLRMKKRREEVVNGKSGNSKELNNETKKYVNFLITRVLVAVIIFFGVVIMQNTTTLGKNFIEEKVLKENISFTEIGNLYNKYFGNVLPFEDVLKGDQTVFSENLSYEEISNYKDGYELKVPTNYLVPVVNAGIVVFIGEKEDYGHTVIIQGIDEVDYWYSNVDNLSVSLYDYVSKGSYLGTAKGDKIYMTFKKGSDFLEYDEVVK